MRKRNMILGLMCGLLTVFVFFQAVPLRGEEGVGNTVRSDRSASSDAVAALKEQIENQQKQIEQLSSTLAQRQQMLNRSSAPVTTVTAQNRSSVGASASNPGPQSDQQKVDDLELIKRELQAIADSAAQANQRLTKIETDAAAYNKSNDAKLKQLGVFSLSGDIRIRYEPFFQEGAADRNRERVRLRFNVNGKLSDEFSGGFSLASGTLDDPVSTNQSFTGYLNRKNIGIDKAFVSYKPKYAKFLKLDAGKFSYPWYRTPMTFDSDVNPEGFAQTLSFDFKSPMLKNLTLVGFQLPINEVSGGPDSFIIGGQIQTQFKLSSKARLGLYGAGINFLRSDPLGAAAIARSAGTLVGSLNNFNSVKTNASGTKIYAYKFIYLDTIMKLDLDTSPRFPTTILYNFVNNTRGPSERSGYWTELTVGRQKQAKDIQFNYTFARIEKDAVISAFNESDLRASTNLRQNKLQIACLFQNNVTGQFTAWIGKLANPLFNTDQVPSGVRGACTGIDVSGCVDPYLKRLQFDVIYKF
jgi:hypothetical protein